MKINATPGSIRTVLEYHARTKHHLDRYARSLGYLDWSTQPDPFRRYKHAPLIALSASEPDARPPLFDDLYVGNGIVPRTVSADTIAQLFYDSLAISAWKAIPGNRWPLRCNPSSGNLHPTEAYLLCDAMAGFGEGPGLYHYRALEHALELRGSWGQTDWQKIVSGAPGNTFFIGLSSIHWREAWKYGERAYRYCQQDVGHAVAALTFAALTLGWSVHSVTNISDDLLASLLGIQAQRGPDAEHPDCLLAVVPQFQGMLNARVTLEFLSGLDAETWTKNLLQHRPNDLSQRHQNWPVIDRVAAACRIVDDSKPRAIIEVRHASSTPADLPKRKVLARKILRQRRSAVAMDGHTAIGCHELVRMLYRVLPGSLPLGALPGDPAIHLLLFIHRVDGLQPGLYLLVRATAAEADFRKCMHSDFLWEVVETNPVSLPLFRLAEGDARAAAKTVSCHQDIAADGAFAVAMLAEFGARLKQQGAAHYRRMHWEAGAIGQVLYLEAEAAGIRSTGIGCFFDDAVHDLLGLQGLHFQTIYHFTVGGPIEDHRIETLAAYPPP